MTGICGHIPGVTCSNCAPRPPSIVPWPSSPPDALGRIADALEKLVVALTAADRYAANEAKQREEAEPDPLDENNHRDRQDCDGMRLIRVGSHHWHPPDAARCGLGCNGLSLANWNDCYGPLTFAPDAEPDPLDENDHRDRLIADRRRIVRHGQGHWHTPATSGTWCDADCTEMSLQHWARVYGPLTFAPDAEPDPLDETDRRNRWDRDREPLMPCVSGKWHYFDPLECPSSAGVQHCEGRSLLEANDVYGPLTFAPEPPPEDSSTHYYRTNIDRAPDGTAWSWGVAECHCNRPWRHE